MRKLAILLTITILLLPLVISWGVDISDKNNYLSPPSKLESNPFGGYAYHSVHNPTKEMMVLYKDTPDLKMYANAVSNGIKEYGIQEKILIRHDYSVEDKCSINFTCATNINLTCVTKSATCTKINKTEYSSEWKDTDKIILYPDDTKEIRFVFVWAQNIMKQKLQVDYIPQVANNIYSEYAWYNISCGTKRNISFSNTYGTETYKFVFDGGSVLNYTNTFNASNITFVNSAENKMLPYIIDYVNNSRNSNQQFVAFVNVSGQDSIYMYSDCNFNADNGVYATGKNPAMIYYNDYSNGVSNSSCSGSIIQDNTTTTYGARRDNKAYSWSSGADCNLANFNYTDKYRDFIFTEYFFKMTDVQGDLLTCSPTAGSCGIAGASLYIKHQDTSWVNNGVTALRQYGTTLGSTFLNFVFQSNYSALDIPPSILYTETNGTLSTMINSSAWRNPNKGYYYLVHRAGAAGVYVIDDIKIWAQNRNTNMSLSGIAENYSAPVIYTNFTIAVYSNKTGIAILSPWNVTINGTIRYNLTAGGPMPTNFSGGWVSINISSRYFGNYYNPSVSMNGTFNISLIDRWVIKAIDFFNRTNLSVWNVTIDLFTPEEVTYNVSGQGEAITDINWSNTGLHWTIVEATGYSGNGLSFWNQTANASHNLVETLWQTEVSMGAMEKASYNIISGGTFKSAYMNSTGILKLPAGPITIYFNKTGYYNQSADFTFINQNYTGLGDQYISEVYNRILNITAYAINTSNLSVFNVSIVSNNYPVWSDFNSTIIGVSQFFLINGSYNLTLSSNGFWEEHINNRSTEGMGNINQAMYRFRVNVRVLNGINSSPVIGYNITTMWNNTAVNFNTSNGSVSVTQLDVPFYMNLTSFGFSNFTFNMTGTPHGEVNLTINMSAMISWRVLHESDGVTPFNVNATNFTKVWIYCPGKTYTFQFFPSYTITQAIDCPWYLQKLDVQYPTSSYFKTYIPTLNSTNITLYAIDLGDETAVEIIFILNDMTGQYQNSTLIITEPLGGGELVVLAQQWDIENKVVAYLIKDRLYSIKIQALNGELRVIGSFIPESAGTKTITIPNILFLPPTHLGSSVLWAWSVNATPIRLQYNDTLTQTDWIDFRVLNASNTSQILTSSSAGTMGIVTFSYNAPTNLTDYIACFNASHSVLGNIGECHVYSNVISPLGSWDGWTPSEANKIRNWIAIVCIMLVLLGAGYFHVAVGLGLGTFLLWFFLKIGWFFLVNAYVTYAVLGIMATITAISFFLEVTRK